MTYILNIAVILINFEKGFRNRFISRYLANKPGYPAGFHKKILDIRCKSIIKLYSIGVVAYHYLCNGFTGEIEALLLCKVYVRNTLEHFRNTPTASWNLSNYYLTLAWIVAGSNTCYSTYKCPSTTQVQQHLPAADPGDPVRADRLVLLLPHHLHPPPGRVLHCIQVQGDQLNMAVRSRHLVESDLSSVHVDTGQ